MGDRAAVPLPEHGFDPVIVLVRTAHPGNLGAVCRAMLNFGFSRLRLIDPQCQVDEEARKRAKFAGSVLDDMHIYPDWSSCMEDIGLIVGTTGKREGGSRPAFRHLLEPADVSEMAKGHGGKVAIVFGEEGVGLTTPELDRCDVLATIPTWEGYPICNLSHAVAVMLFGMQGASSATDVEDPLQGGMRETLSTAINQFAGALQAEGTRERMVEQTLGRVLSRGLPSNDEAQQIIGSLVEATTALQKVSGDDDWMRGRRKRLSDQD